MSNKYPQKRRQRIRVQAQAARLDPRFPYVWMVVLIGSASALMLATGFAMGAGA